MSAKPHLSALHGEIVRLAGEGVPAVQIAETLGCCKSGIRKYCRRHEIRLVDVKNIFPTHREAFLAMANADASAPAMAEYFAVSVTAIYRWAEKCGFKVADTYHKGYAITWNGYKLVPASQHPNANSKGYVGEHRLVMERRIGRYLLPSECVHHKDRDKLNNDIDNLELMTLSEHAALHAAAGDTGWAYYHKNAI